MVGIGPRALIGLDKILFVVRAQEFISLYLLGNYELLPVVWNGLHFDFIVELFLFLSCLRNYLLLLNFKIGCAKLFKYY